MTHTKSRSGDLVATDRSEQDRVVDFLGAVVPLRARALPASSTEADLSNVVPIASRRRFGPERKGPDLVVNAADRPAPLSFGLERRHQLALLLAASVAVHASLFAAFNREPPPLASIGEVSVSVELVLGADRAAGRSQAPSESEVASAASPKQPEPEAAQQEAPRKAETREPEAAPAPAEKPETPKEVAAISQPPITAVTPPTPEAELPAPSKEPVKEPVKPAAAEERPSKPDARKPEPRPVKETKRTSDDGQSERKRSAPASTPSVASNSVGRGRSDADTNYRGIVAAHLARYKQFPADARSRGDQGTATVSFSLDGGGRVTSVRLARGSGSGALDQETQAMVRRASPFPAPPSGHGMSFTVPISFYLR